MHPAFPAAQLVRHDTNAVALVAPASAVAPTALATAARTTTS